MSLQLGCPTYGSSCIHHDLSRTGLRSRRVRIREGFGPISTVVGVGITFKTLGDIGLKVESQFGSTLQIPANIDYCLRVLPPWIRREARALMYGVHNIGSSALGHIVQLANDRPVLELAFVMRWRIKVMMQHTLGTHRNGLHSGLGI